MKAAGILFVTLDGNALFLKRGPTAPDFPDCWDFPGGGTEDDETPEQTAVRETKEEIGTLPKGERRLHTRQRMSTAVSLTPAAGAGAAGLPVASDAPAAVPAPAPPEPVQTTEVEFTTFLQMVAEEFTPKLNEEHTGYAWAPLSSPPEPLHPGCRVALARMTMDELGIARAIRDGMLTSPQRYENVSLFALRITGTGVAFRHKHDEWVIRDPALYLNDDFLARCNGLPVIWKHPDKQTLNSEEFADRVVGTVLLPYIKGDEVWGIAKIYDDAAVKMMEEKQLSTSPAVVFRKPISENQRLELEDGSKLLIEGVPSLLDHLAICEQGVWDKGGEPTGVDAGMRGDSTMSDSDKTKAVDVKADDDEKKRDDAKRDDAKRDDADAGQKLDKILTAMDSMSKRMDSMEKRMDDDDAKRDDARKRDDAKKRDDEEKEEKEKEDRDDAKKRDDARKRDDEGEEKKEEPEETVADRKKRDDDSRKDARKRDDAKRDDEEKDEKKEEEKADAKRDDSDLHDRLARLERRVANPLTDKDFHAMADAQARADDVFALFGQHAPRPLDGETLSLYRRRVAKALKAHSKQWKDVDVGAVVDSVAFDIMEKQIYADAAATARSPIDVPLGTLREMTSRDRTGRLITEFAGAPASWMHTFGGNRMKLASIRNTTRT